MSFTNAMFTTVLPICLCLLWHQKIKTSLKIINIIIIISHENNKFNLVLDSVENKCAWHHDNLNRFSSYLGFEVL